MRKWFRSGVSLLLAVFVLVGSASVLRVNAAGSECAHSYVNGFCSQCDACEPAALIDGVYQISNAGQLYWFAEFVNIGNGDVDAVLTADIEINRNVLVDGALNPDATAVADFRAWIPVGYQANTDYYQYYTGTFDGQGHRVSGLYYNGNSDSMGLFGITDTGAVIRNVGLTDSWISAGDGGYASVGAIAGKAVGTNLENCWNESVIIGMGNAVGGIVGVAGNCVIENCRNAGDITGSSLVGGIAGTFSGNMTGCANIGDITGSETGNSIGGVVGEANHDSDIAGSDGYYARITQCSNTGDVRNGYKIGGILGTGNYCVLDDCYNTGDVTGQSGLVFAAGAGGVLGDANRGCTVSDCYNVGTVGANYNKVGGVIGGNIQSSVDNSYYLADSETDALDGTTAKTAAQFASGEVAWLLNGSTDEGELVWKQTIGKAEYPVFTGAVVHHDAQAEPPYYNEAHVCADTDPADHKCDICEEVLSQCEDKNNDHKCDICDAVLSQCIDENENYVCDICGAELEKPASEKGETIRLAGEHRWNTAIKVADEMKANLNIEKFDAIIIASGNDFADALAGSYLSTVKNAPILLAWGQGGAFEFLDTDNINYIKANLAEDGIVYILGGEKAVPTLYETELADYNVKRLGGADRFETNLLILEEAGIDDGSEILVCTATNFADSLSASATGKPILLVFNNLTELIGKQPEFLAKLQDCTFTVIGGKNAVSDKLAEAIGEYGKVERLAGTNRFETSVLVAQKYFENPETAVLAYAWNYPDGLCGGSLAFSLKAPLILTMTKYEDAAVEYAKTTGITSGLVLGGDSLISDASVRSIFAMDGDAEIVVK